MKILLHFHCGENTLGVALFMLEGREKESCECIFAASDVSAG